MTLIDWEVYRKFTDPDSTEVIGRVTTGTTATNGVAWAKAAHKYIPKPYITLGWSLHVRKIGMREV